VIDDNDALLARGCRRASHKSDLPPATELPSTSGSSFGCLLTGGGGAGIAMEGSGFG